MFIVFFSHKLLFRAECCQRSCSLHGCYMLVEPITLFFSSSLKEKILLIEKIECYSHEKIVSTVNYNGRAQTKKKIKGRYI